MPSLQLNNTMAINFDAGGGALDASPDNAMLSEINTTPLVDVMLVLLIIFLITIPVVNAAVAVRLPKELNVLQQRQPQTINVSIDAAGATYWFDAKLPNHAALQERLVKAVAGGVVPEIHIRGDAASNYQAVARVVLACQQAGITRIGFITEPPGRP
jgi:biopolymer transport protein ExbD